MPRKARKCCKYRTGRPSCFNEAAALMPRKGARNELTNQERNECFNEAAALMPRKASVRSAGRACSGRFNEAAALMPRKGTVVLFGVRPWIWLQ